MADDGAGRETSTPQRRKLYRHDIQQRYGGLVGVSLFIYSVLIFGIVLLIPIVPSVLRASSNATPFAAREFIVLVEQWWPAGVALLAGAALLSVLLTKRIGGPLYRLEQTVRSLSDGDLALRLKFRVYDGKGMHGLAASYNEAVD